MSAKLDIFEFGRQLLETNDLDPVYVVLHKAGFERKFLQRWLLAYWCFYHSGTASWICDSQVKEEPVEPYYWAKMERAAASSQWPRCHERRHFRGNLAVKSIEYLRERGLEDLFLYFDLGACEGSFITVKDAMTHVKQWYGFGEWIAFKVADMLDRLGLCNIVFDDGAMFLFDSPREGAELLWDELCPGINPNSEPGGINQWAVETILDRLGKYQAPPRYERPINCQEAETILCKFKSHRGGHYEVGEDIVALRSGLLRFSKSKTAQRLLRAATEANLRA